MLIMELKSTITNMNGWLEEGGREQLCQKEVEQHFSSAERKNYQSQTPYTVKLFFRNEREIRTQSDKRKLKEFVTR